MKKNVAIGYNKGYKSVPEVIFRDNSICLRMYKKALQKIHDNWDKRVSG